MSDTTSTPEVENAFAAPEADLTTPTKNKPILEMKRFSAWGVFGLSIITFGIYILYWMFTRAFQINALSKVAKCSIIAIYVYIATSVLTNVVPFVLTDLVMSFPYIILIFSFVGIIAFFVYIFSVRKALREVINVGSEEEVKIGPIKTFFFNVLYIQYKINQAIDNQSK